MFAPSPARSPRRSHHLRTLVLLLLTAIGAGLLTLRPAYAAPDLLVRLTIERVIERSCLEGSNPFGCNGEPDFYAVVQLDGEEFSTTYIGDKDDISPNWTFTKLIDFGTRRTMPISVAIYDSDGGARGNDDHVDITPGPGSDLALTVNLSPCGVSGDLSSLCGTSMSSIGGGGDRAEVQLRIDLEVPATPGLQVRCTHDVLWPQGGEPLTVRAAALDATRTPKYVDSIEVWVNGTGVPAGTLSGGSVLELPVGPYAAGTSFSYGCLVRSGAEVAWSGWRTVQVGNPPAGRVVPVVFTGAEESRIDIVLMADQDSYTGVADPLFLADARDVIQRAYYDEDLFLRHQDKLNFWLALEPADARNSCGSQPPSNWDDSYTFADAGAILHRDGTIRDCALGGLRIFSGDVTRSDGGRFGRVFLHETGHQPFGLADEYCCDGGYWQDQTFPNLFADYAACRADELGADPTGCGAFTDINGATWYRLDGAADDLMVNNLAPQPADARRIEWLFDQCRSSRC